MSGFPIRVSTLLFAASLATVLAPADDAVAFPDKPISFLVGAGAGGSTDAGARILAQAMEKQLKQPIVVLNKTGGGGSKALVLLKNEKADGYTLAFAYAHHVTFQPHYQRKESLYKAADFDYIGSITAPHMSIVALNKGPWKDLKEMIAQYRKEGKPLSLAYSGGPGRLVGNAIAKGLGYPVKIITEKSGGKTMQKLLGGHVDLVYSGGAHSKYTDAGKTKVVATAGNDTDPDYPAARTLVALGVDAATPTLQVLVAPKGVPADRLKILSTALAAARKDSAMIKLFETNLKMHMDSKGPDALRAYMMKSEEQYLKLIKNHSK
jgi:tripartite-type tricarboxylate transporter receptor subunit TctC